MSQITRAIITTVFIALFALLATGCADSNNNFNPDTGKHTAGWDSPDAHGAGAKRATSGFTSCQDCHGADLGGGISATSCYTCHGVNAPHPAAPWRGTRTHATTDPSNAEACAVCHEGGANSSVQPVPPAPPGTPPGCFNATLCHATPGHPVGWSNPDQHGITAKSQTTTGFSYCQSCHGTDFAGSGAAVTCLNNTASCHVGTSGFPYGPSPHAAAPWRTSAGSARTHTNTDETNAGVCFQCHVDGMYSSNTHSSSARLPDTEPSCYNNWLCHATPNPHLGNPTWANATDHGLAAKSAPTSTHGFSYCQSCHGVDFAGGTTTTTCLNNCHLDNASNPVNAPHGAPWTSTSTYRHSETDEGNAMVCGLCHLDELTNGVGSRTYQPLPGGTTINGCFDGRLCHTASSIGCVNCHASAVSAPIASSRSGGTVTQRRAIVPEFQLASNHVRNKSGGVTDADCGVCHMEGNAADGSANAAYHRNGYIDLRDPDTGNQIQTATWGGTGAGSYTSSAPTISAVRFSRNLGSATLESFAVSAMINQCLHCHDSNGASSSSAQVTGGSAANPFNGTAANMPANGVLDVASQFATATNRSYHPILGRQNNSYADSNRMAAPWNGVTKTEGSLTGWGPLMTCWDCHAMAGSSGVQTSSVTAHGSAVTNPAGGTNAVELRGQVWRTGTVGASNNTTLCIICHAGYDANTGSNHGTGSAFTSSTNNGMTNYLRYACYYCHSSGPTKAARPTPAGDAHGFDTRAGGIAFSGTNAAAQGYAFIRSEGFYSNGYRQNTGSVSGTIYTATCSGFSGTNGSSNCSRGSMGNYSPGGVY